MIIIKEFLNDVLEGKYMLSDCVTLIMRKCNNDKLLNTFLNDFKDEVDYVFMGFLLELNDIQKMNVIEHYKRQGKQIPTVKLSEQDCLRFGHLLREVNGIKYISNIRGFENSENPFVEPIFLDEAIRPFDEVDFTGCFFDFGDTTIVDKYSNLILLWKIEDFISEELNDQPQPVAKNNLPELPENNFDETDIKDVYQYFKTHLVDKKRLTEDDLILYLKVAFEDEKQPENRFRLDYNVKKDIQKVFYLYYKDIAGSTHGMQQQYVNLLKNYFVGFEKLSTTNFSKIY